MTSKAIEKKNYILENAANVFMRKGYTSVTMKDIVEECGISRGGLYRYYGSTKEIFEDILSLEKENDYCYFIKCMENEMNAIAILNEFLQRQKNELLNTENTIRVAIYEFFLSQRNNPFEEVLEKYFNDAVTIVSKTLSYGISRKEIAHLDVIDIEKTARHIVILLEGLNLLSMSISISPELIQEQIDMILKTIIYRTGEYNETNYKSRKNYKKI
ncbi:TetR/AcrR family transcriptional regulator [Bacillus chungangensis]|uniref:AcrR family transcriptional regulator n=1 Tax=Bacillus chungangensis TaxID=587633 RepID=A0ABT9WT20_9BACI|nr:TetR/AcrR family transcriptional regulator [Bacillus chungangensis]MDQ0176360.1 AcrR family transcriptional regulator [Bacillus chungangensis]